MRIWTMAFSLFVLAFTPARAQTIRYYDLPNETYAHDVAPAPDGGIWYTAQRDGALGHLDPTTGKVTTVPLGRDSAPHGVIVGPDAAAWITDGGQNAIVRVDGKNRAVRVFKLPPGGGNANLNTSAFDKEGVLWFTGQNGIYGRLHPATGEMKVFRAPKGVGPYGITVTPSGEVYYASLAGSYIAKIDRASGAANVIEPPTSRQGARRVWSDSKGRIWVSEWDAGQVGLYDPAANTWKEWKLPGRSPRAYAVYVDERDKVWLSDFGGNAIVRFDPASETFQTFQSNKPGASVRQLLGRAGEIWGAESGNGRLVVISDAP